MSSQKLMWVGLLLILMSCGNPSASEQDLRQAMKECGIGADDLRWIVSEGAVLIGSPKPAGVYFRTPQCVLDWEKKNKVKFGYLAAQLPTK